VRLAAGDAAGGCPHAGRAQARLTQRERPGGGRGVGGPPRARAGGGAARPRAPPRRGAAGAGQAGRAGRAGKQYILGRFFGRVHLNCNYQYNFWENMGTVKGWPRRYIYGRFLVEYTCAHRNYQCIVGDAGIVKGWPRRAAAASACRWTPRCRCCASGPRSVPGAPPAGVMVWWRPRRAVAQCRCFVIPVNYWVLHNLRWSRRRARASARLRMECSRHETLPTKPYRRARLVHRLDRAVSGAMAVARTADAAAWLSAAFARPAQALAGGAAPRGGAPALLQPPDGGPASASCMRCILPASVYVSLWLAQRTSCGAPEATVPALTAAVHAWRSLKKGARPACG